MMDQPHEDKESRLLKIVEAIAISPEDAEAIAEQYLNQSRSKYPNDSEWEHQLRAAKKVIRRYSQAAGMVGGASGLSGVIPGLGTAVAVVGGATADTALCMKFQVDMCMCLGPFSGTTFALKTPAISFFSLLQLAALNARESRLEPDLALKPG